MSTEVLIQKMTLLAYILHVCAYNESIFRDYSDTLGKVFLNSRVEWSGVCQKRGLFLYTAREGRGYKGHVECYTDHSKQV